MPERSRSITDVALENTKQALLGTPLINNSIRGIYAEHLLAAALGGCWKVTAEWDSWDLEHDNGWRIEVKQSAMAQPWHTSQAEAQRAKPQFDIRERGGYWENNAWVAKPGRAAPLYIFAFHGETDLSVADHRAADQWVFFVVEASALPNQKTIGLGGLRKIAEPVAITDLPVAVGRFFDPK